MIVVSIIIFALQTKNNNISQTNQTNLEMNEQCSSNDVEAQRTNSIQPEMKIFSISVDINTPNAIS